MNTLNHRLGKRIRLFRNQSGLTQAQLAEKTGLSDNFIGLIERGIKQPTIDTLHKIVKSLDVTLEELFKNTTEETSKKPAQELRELLAKRNFKDSELLLDIYKTICEYRNP